MILGGIYSSTRQAIKGPAVVDGRTLYIYPEQYEGQECDPLIFCTGPVPGAADRAAHPVADGRDRREDVLLPVGRLHLAARPEREGPGGRDGQRRLDRRRGVLPARSHRLPRDGRADHRQRRRGRLQHDRPAGALAVPRAPPRLGLRGARRVARLHVLRRELPQPRAGRARRGPVQLPRLLRERRRSVQQGAARSLQRALSGRRQVHGRQRVLGDVPRAEAVGGRRHRGRAHSTRTTSSRRSITRRSPTARAARPRWCPASTTFG